MPTPVEFLRRYHNLQVKVAIDDQDMRVCREVTYRVKLNKYFMMDWEAGTEELRDYNAVTQGSSRDLWFRRNSDRIRRAAMGKGSPEDYELALEWAVRSKKVAQPSQMALQTYCDDHLGIDCSGFATAYLKANGRTTYSNAASYYSTTRAVNDSTAIRQGDLLVWMKGNAVKRRPGHIAIVDSYVPECRPGGNMRVAESMGSKGLVDSMYSVEQIVDAAKGVPMIFVVKRHGNSRDRVTVMRV